jgi:hypothetical protein
MGHVKLRSRTEKAFYRLNRDRKLREQRFKCYYCECKLDYKTATVDHIIPLKDTGRYHRDDNTVVACVPCNSSKGHQSMAEFTGETVSVPKLPRQFRYDKSPLGKAMERIETRIKRAEYNLDMAPAAKSFPKWLRYWKKRGRF